MVLAKGNNKYILNVQFEQDFNANSKAKSDITYFAQQMGFKTINVPYLGGIDKFKFIPIINKITKILHTGDVLLIQYPTYLGVLANRLLVSRLHQYGVKLIALIHDVDSLRFKVKKYQFWKTLSAEIEFLNEMNFVIVPNTSLQQYLTKNGLKKPTGALGLFDYQSKVQMSDYDKKQSKSLLFAGNLIKSEFISRLTDLKLEYKLSLFGVKGDMQNFGNNTEYLGIFPPEVLSPKINHGFGLVWDGPDLETCSGLVGKYLQYNNPHKVSLYLSSGVPVIIWRQAAVAEFVKKNKVGILIDSLYELNQKLSQLSTEDITEMVRNSRIIGARLRNGDDTRAAINTALLSLRGENS